MNNISILNRYLKVLQKLKLALDYYQYYDDLIRKFKRYNEDVSKCVKGIGISIGAYLTQNNNKLCVAVCITEIKHH